MEMKKKKTAIVLVLVLLFSLIFSLLYKWMQTGNPFSAETIMFGSIILMNILITGSIAYSVYKKYSKKASIQLKKDVIPAFIIFVLVALIISLLIVSGGVYAFYLIKGFDTSNFLSHLFKVELTSAIKQFSIWILIGSVFFFYIIWRKSIEREQLLHKENLKFKYRNLKSQVNPHFLFNSLNTLSELVYIDAKKADNYIQKLSGIYRYILENEKIDLIPLNEELEFVQQYFALQKERDSDKIILDIDIPNATNYKIIPISLQLLIENALKHNSMSKENPLVIKLNKSDDYIIVSNIIQRKNIMESSTQIGLSNLRERVRLIVGRELIKIEENNQFTVKLPIIKLT